MLCKFLILAFAALAYSRPADQETSGQNALLSGNQVDVAPVDVSNNNVLPVLNGNQIAVPVDASNILNGNSILNPDIGSIPILLPITAVGNHILGPLLRRRRDAGQVTSGQDGTVSGNQVDVLPVGVNGNNVLPIGNANQIAVPVDLSNILNGNSILNPDIGSISAVAPIVAAGNHLLSPLLRRRRDAAQVTSGQDGTVSGNQVDVLPVGVNDNNVAPVLNGNQIAVPIDASNILNKNNILDPVIGTISAIVPVGILGNNAASPLLRRRRDAGQVTSGQSGTASGNQVDVLPVGVNGNNVAPVLNGNQIAVPIDASNILNGNDIGDANIGKILLALPVSVLGNNIATQLL